MALGRSDVHVSVPLTNFAIRYIQDAKNFIADDVLPPLPVDKMINQYYIFDRGNWRTGDDVRAASSKPNRTSPAQLSRDSYNMNRHSLYDIVPNDVIDEADVPLAPLQDTVVDITQQLLVNKEYAIAAYCAITASVDGYTSLATASQWGYTSTTTPLKDVTTGINTVLKSSGIKPNVGFCGNPVYQVLKNHADIIDRIKYTQRGIVTADIIAACMDLDNFLVGNAVYMSTAEGVTSEATSFIWGKNMTVAYVNPRPAMKAVSWGYQFVKKGGTIVVKQFPVQKEDGVWVEGNLYYDKKITSTYAGYTIFGAVA